MKRKFIAGMLLVTMACNLAACGSDKKEVTKLEIETTENPEAEEMDTEELEDVTEDWEDEDILQRNQIQKK